VRHPRPLGVAFRPPPATEGSSAATLGPWRWLHITPSGLRVAFGPPQMDFRVARRAGGGSAPPSVAQEWLLGHPKWILGWLAGHSINNNNNNNNNKI
jgi:hypothetical protein